jgi:hypothetical protein
MSDMCGELREDESLAEPHGFTQLLAGDVLHPHEAGGSALLAVARGFEVVEYLEEHFFRARSEIGGLHARR